MTMLVAVHGAGTGGWLWDDVAGRLAAAGHQVRAEYGRCRRAHHRRRESTDVSSRVEQIVTFVEGQRLTDVALVG